MDCCRRCGSEKNSQSYCCYYRRCKVCNSAMSLKYYYKNREKILERLKERRDVNKENTSNENKKRYSKYYAEINSLKDQIEVLTNRLNTLLPEDINNTFLE